MTSQTGKNSRSWHRVMCSGAVVGTLAAGLLAGLGVTTAIAQTDDSTTETPAPVAEGPTGPCTGDDCHKTDPTPTMTADQALSIIANEYDTGAGGGQLSQLVHQVMRLRSQGFRPSNANRLAIEQALEKRPNQSPLVEALKATLSYQKKLQAQKQQAVSQAGPQAGPPPVVGPTAGPMPGGGVGITGPNGGGIVLPVG
jgi:hypothetical protein